MEETKRVMRYKCINKDIIKYLAMFTMLLNHIAHVFLEEGTVLAEVFEDIGYFTAITMVYFLLEGYEYTHSKKKYAQRLLIFAIIAQVPYTLAFDVFIFNMLFTLLWCFLILYAKEHIKNHTKCIFAIIGLFLLSLFSDWSCMAPAFMLLLDKYRKENQIYKAYIISFLIFVIVMFPMKVEDMGYAMALVRTAIAGIPLFISGLFTQVLYNGKRIQRARNFSKWFFYAFYPGHLIILTILKFVMK